MLFGASPPSVYEQTAQKAMVGPDARHLWEEASDPFSRLGPFRLALDAPFQSPGLVRKREFSDTDRTFIRPSLVGPLGGPHEGGRVRGGNGPDSGGDGAAVRG